MKNVKFKLANLASYLLNALKLHFVKVLTRASISSVTMPFTTASSNKGLIAKSSK
jgi:hypothetical protein